MQVDKDFDSGVFCAIPFYIREFIEHHGIFRLLESTFVDPTAGIFAVRQIMKIYCSAFGFSCWFSYYRHTGVVHTIKKYCAKVHHDGEPAKRFLPIVAVVGLRSFIHIKDARRALCVYRREFFFVRKG